MTLDASQIEHRHALVKCYCDVWCETDDAKRLQLLRTCFEDTGTYSDPTVHLESLTRLNDYLSDLHRRFPRSKVLLTSELQTYRNVGRFDWDWALEDSTVRRRGVDFVTFSGAGKLQGVVGFFNPL